MSPGFLAPCRGKRRFASTPEPDPREHRLAVRTEDHPLDRETFEGTIARGEYGGRGKQDSWLLTKKADEHSDARRRPTGTQKESAPTGRTLAQIAADA